MATERLQAAYIAGVDLGLNTIRTKYSKVIERTVCRIEDVEYVRLNEVREARPHLLFVGTAHNANVFLAGYIEYLEDGR